MTTRSRSLFTGLAIACVPALAACGSSSSHSSSASASATAASASSATPASGAVRSGHVSVAIKNYKFAPPALVVKAGTKVTFTDDDQTAHTATSNKAGAFDTGTIAPGKSKTITLTKPGTYTYYCQFHPFMTATVTVK